MKAELVKLLTLYNELEEIGTSATLTLLTRGGKSTYKLLLDSPPSSPVTSTTSSTQARRRRRRSAVKRARANQRAADHQANLVGAVTAGEPTGGVPLPDNPAGGDPLPSQTHSHNIHPSPSPSSGRREVITVGRPTTASFASLNLDGSSSTPSPLPLTPAVPSNTTATACTSTDSIVNQATTKLHYTLPPGVHPAMVPPSDPQLAAKWFACIWCRAGGCRPDWCEYRG